MIFGESGVSGSHTIPRIVTLGVNRPVKSLPRRGDDLPFRITVHEEGAPLTWVTDTSLPADAEAAVLDGTAALARFSQGQDLTRRSARRTAVEVGRIMSDLVLGHGVRAALDDLSPSAIHLEIDETVLDLPWELIGADDHELALDVPVGRLVSSRVRPRPRRDPLAEDKVVRILVVENPTGDLAATTAEVDAIQSLAGRHGAATAEITVLENHRATRAGFDHAVRRGAFDMVHFAGHARFDSHRPGASALYFADGETLRADDVASIPWASPPYVVFNSACESGRGARNRRLVSRTGSAAGLPAAFLAAGIQGYLGHFFAVDDGAASTVARTFYEALFRTENVGRSVTEARRSVRDRFEDRSDLACFGLTYFGDAGGAERADLAEAV